MIGSLMINTLQAGTAKAEITPATSLPMTRRSGRLLPDPAKTFCPLCARVLVLNDGQERLVIITHDLSSLTYTTGLLRTRLQEELGIDAHHLAPIATHNHLAPLMRLQANRPYGEWLAEKLFELVQEAIAAERPARVRFGQGRATFARNQEWRAPADHDVQLLSVEHDGGPCAFLFNYACHPSGWAVDAYGSDFAGLATSELEREVPGLAALFGQACGGDQFFITPQGCLDPLEAIRCRGKELADEVLRVWRGPMREVTGRLSSRLETLQLPLARPIAEADAARLAQEPDHPKWVDSVLDHYRAGKPFPTAFAEEVLVARIGSLAFVALQGEVCSAIGGRIKDIVGEAQPTMVYSCMGEREIYLPSREILRVNSYQAEVVQTMGGSPCAWAAEVEDAAVSGVVRLLISPEDLAELESRGQAA